MHEKRRPLVFLVCSGLGRIRRGFESFTNECFNELSHADPFDIWLLQGRGKQSKRRRTVISLFRKSRFTRWLARITGKTPYFIEQVTFGFCALPYLLAKKPDLIFVSDGTLANMLWHFRRLFGLKYKILFSNGGPLNNDLGRWDHIQQLVPAHMKKALDLGIPSDKQTLLPYAVKIQKDYAPANEREKAELRAKLGLPIDRKIILSVGIINKHHKRMDYIIREVASMPEPSPYLLILGQCEAETPEIEAMAHEVLGEPNYSIRSVEPEDTEQYYRLSDVFVLASLMEGLARVFLEALAAGLPAIAHNYEVPKYVFDENEHFIDMKINGALTQKLRELVGLPHYEGAARSRHAQAYNRFSWDRLIQDYIRMFQYCLGGKNAKR